MAQGQYGFIEGHVYSAADDRPIAGALLFTVPATYQVRTSASGAYTLRVPAGTCYGVFARKAGFRPSETSIVVEAHRARRTCDFVLRGTGQSGQSGPERAGGTHGREGSAGFSGLLFGADGEPLERVRVRTSPTSASVYTDRHGVYFLAVERPRGTRYTLRFTKGGYRTETAEMVFSAGLVRRCDALMLRSGEPPRRGVSFASLGLVRGPVMRGPDLRTRHGRARPRTSVAPRGRPRLR